MSPSPAAWLRYPPQAFAGDLVAALVVSVLLVPQAVAYALLAGLPAEVGVYASLLPMLAYAALGASSVNAVGPAAVLALMTAQAIEPAVAAGVRPVDAAMVLALESGALLALAAVLRFDALASLLSVPVLQGFSVGASLSILISQLPVLLGAGATGSRATDVAAAWWRSAQPVHLATAAFGLGTWAALVLARRHGVTFAARRLGAPRAQAWSRAAPLVILALATAVAVLTAASSHGVRTVGALPELLRSWSWPPTDPALWRQLLPAGALLALVTFVSSLAVAEPMALQRGQRLRSGRELAGLAGANLAAGLAGGMPVGSSFSRTAVNAEAGAQTRFAGVLAAVFTGLTLLLFADALAHVPKAALAATIVVSVVAAGEWRGFAATWRYARAEAALMAAVAAITVLADAHWGLAFGVAGSVALLLQRTARPHAVVVGRVPGTEHYRNVRRHATEQGPGVLGIRIDESLLYINARQLPDVVVACLDGAPGIGRVLLQMSPVNHIDFSGVEALRTVQDVLARRGIRLDLSEVKGPVLDALEAGHWREWFRGGLFLSHHQGVAAPTGDEVSPPP